MRRSPSRTSSRKSYLAILAIAWACGLPGCSGTDPGARFELEGEAGDRLAAARLLEHRGRMREAWESYRRLTEEVPDAISPWEGLTRCARGDFERAITASRLEEHAGKLPFEESIPWRTLRLVLEPDLVLREQMLYELAERAGDLEGWPRTALGEIFLERGNAAAALEAFERALDETSGLPRAHDGRAAALMELGRPLEAVTSYETFLASHPRDPVALYNLGWILLKLRNRARDARPYLERAAAVLPDDVAVLLALGAVSLEVTPPDVETARTCILRALELAPDDPDVHWNLGVLLADHVGDRRGAAAHFRRYIELGGSGKARVERWIQELQADGP